MKILPYIALFALFVAAPASCSKVEENTPAGSGRVVLAYLGGDNNLSGEAYAKAEALRQGYTSHVQDNLQGRLLIYIDPADGPPRLLEVYTDGGQSKTMEIREYGEDNSADSATFASVIADVRRLYPNNRYGLLVFSHASGWLPEKTLTNPKSVLADQGREMELTDLAAAIPDGMFEYIVFEACFMSGIEVAYQLGDKTDCILASSAEIVSPGFTEIYPAATVCLFEEDRPMEKFAEKAFGWFNSQSGYQRSATFSVIRTFVLKDLASFVRKNCDPDSEASLTEIQHFDRYSSYRLFFDFEDYYSRLLPTEAQRNELTRLINGCVVWKASTETFMIGFNGFAIGRHSGLTVYIPQERFPVLNDAYAKLDWANDTGREPQNHAQGSGNAAYLYSGTGETDKK
ncbi:MAG: hypothetical protein LBR26_10520 [Prevotella sp.]|nr:hypothetical protein [Prevotella sp.]